MINRRYGNGGPEIEEGEGEGRSLPQTACISINLCACACLFLKNRKRNFDIMDFELYCVSFLHLLRGNDIFFFCMLSWQIILGDLMQNHSPFPGINNTWPWFFFLSTFLF